MKKLIIGLILAVCLLVPVSCAAPPAPAPGPASRPAPGPAPSPGEVPTPPTATYSVQIDFAPSQAVFMSGEVVEIEIRLTNESVEPVTVTQMPPKVSFVLPGPGEDIVKVVRTFNAGTEERELAVGETVNYKLTWDQKDEAGQQAPPGWYFGDFEYAVRIETPPAQDVRSGGRNRLFLIQYPQGAMEMVTELNQTQTATGLPFDVDGEVKQIDIVFTLKHVELSQERASFFVLVTSPNNPLPDYDNHNWRSMRMEARYVIDGVVKDARPHNRKFTDDGIEIRCGYNGSYLDPVPSDAKELVFIVTRFGEWEGPWEFKIPLE